MIQQLIQQVPREEIYSRALRFFLSPIADFLDDPTVSEVMVNGPDVIYVERSGRLEKTDRRFSTPEALEAAVTNLAEYVGRSLDRTAPCLDARLPDGSRVNVLIQPASRVGTCITIRKFSKKVFDLARLIEIGSVTPEQAEQLTQAVAEHRNLIVSGGTGTGKTSLLNALTSLVNPTERVIVIEDSSELQCKCPHTVYLEAQPADIDGEGQVTIRDLFVNSLRMRPDRIIVGELRRGEALDLIQAMLSGHSGAMATVHASTPREALIRLETLCLMSDVSLPVQVARMQVRAAVQTVVQLKRLADGRRVVTTVEDVSGLPD